MTKPELSAPAASQARPASPEQPWWKLLSKYHWFVVIVASSSWLLDCMDQRLFSLARVPALAALMHEPVSSAAVQAFGKVTTAWFLIGWGIGGMIFGALGDRYGRAKMLRLTILTFAMCTGLTFFAQTNVQFTAFRFLSGMGIGGVFGLAVSLIAETVPSGARPHCLGLLQVLSTVGNVIAGFSKMGLDALEANGTIQAGGGWKYMFLVVPIPAAIVILTSRRLREPEPWLKLKAEGRLPKGSILGPYIGLLGAKQWRRNLIIGALLASTGVVGLWAIGEYAVDLQTAVFRTHYEKLSPEVAQRKKAADAAQAALTQAGTPATDAQKAEFAEAKKAYDVAVVKKAEFSKTIAYLLNMLGAGTGMWLFTKFAHAAGRRLAFAVGFSVALVITVVAYWKMNSPFDAYWMMPIMGGAQLGVFAGFAIYLPELFPSRLRSTGTSFCYNLGRFAAAGGSFFSSVLTLQVFGSFAKPLPYRYSAMTMCVIFLVGLATVLWAPETKGKPLPED